MGWQVCTWELARPTQERTLLRGSRGLSRCPSPSRACGAPVESCAQKAGLRALGAVCPLCWNVAEWRRVISSWCSGVNVSVLVSLGHLSLNRALRGLLLSSGE